MRKRHLYSSFFLGLKVIVIFCGSYRCSSASGMALGSAGVIGLHLGIRWSESGMSPSFEGPRRSPAEQSNSKASLSSSARNSSSSRIVTPISCGGRRLRPTWSSVHLARLLVMLDSRTTRRRERDASTCTKPNSTRMGSGVAQGGRSAFSRRGGRSSVWLGTTTTRTAGRREVATSFILCRSVTASGLGASETSPGYWMMRSPGNTCSLFESDHCDGGIMSGTNSTFSETVSSLGTVKSRSSGLSSCWSARLFRVFATSSGAFAGCWPTWLISRTRKGPSTRNRQGTLHGLLFVRVIWRIMQETTPGACMPPSMPPCCAPPSWWRSPDCRFPAATAPWTNLKTGTWPGPLPSVPSGSCTSICGGNSSCCGWAFLSTVRCGRMQSPTHSTTRVDTTSFSGSSASGFQASPASFAPALGRVVGDGDGTYALPSEAADSSTLADSSSRSDSSSESSSS
mmetsp:Transcript_96071/g.248471  ORF Transcript_96071/g.248471 Transcript_96071/m.248471 type:complete len:455 (-) Transcript_96071:430-1794(-)